MVDQQEIFLVIGSLLTRVTVAGEAIQTFTGHSEDRQGVWLTGGLRVARRRIFPAGSGRTAEEPVPVEALSALATISRSCQVIRTFSIVSTIVHDVAANLSRVTEGTVAFVTSSALAAVPQGVSVVDTIGEVVAVVDDVAAGSSLRSASSTISFKARVALALVTSADTLVEALGVRITVLDATALVLWGADQSVSLVPLLANTHVL